VVPHRRFHDLRHSSATLLLAQNVAPGVVMEILGHSQISLTMNTYTHVLPDLKRAAALQIDALIGDEKDEGGTAPAEGHVERTEGVSPNLTGWLRSTDSNRELAVNSAIVTVWTVRVRHSSEFAAVRDAVLKSDGIAVRTAVRRNQSRAPWVRGTVGEACSARRGRDGRA
jgi:hypothetical protein